MTTLNSLSLSIQCWILVLKCLGLNVKSAKMYTSEIHSFENSNYNVKNYEIRTQLVCEEIWQVEKNMNGRIKNCCNFLHANFFVRKKKRLKINKTKQNRVNVKRK